jgi:acyl carrier protein
VEKMALTGDQIVAYLKEELQFDGDLDVESKLFSTGAMDSVAMMQLITFIENTTKIEVRPQDVTLDNFDTVAGIVRYSESQS